MVIILRVCGFLTLMQFSDADPAAATVDVIESIRAFKAFQR